MKRNKIFGFLAGALLMAPAATFAQQALRSGYFLEGYEYRHVMNPDSVRTGKALSVFRS